MKIERITFYIHIYIKIILQDLKSKISYRSDFIISVIGMLCTNIVGFVSFWILFCNFSTIAGWSYYEMLFLYGFSLIAITPVQCFFDNNWNLRTNVYSGDFIKYCFRPINLFFYYQSEIFDFKGIGQFIFGVFILIYSWIKFGISCNLIIVLQVLIGLISASLVMISLQNVAAAACFWIQNSSYFMELVLKLRDYARYPINIYNSVFKFLFTFIIPIAFISYYPSLFVLRPDSIPLLSWLSPIISCILFFLSYKFWMFGALKYNGTGS